MHKVSHFVSIDGDKVGRKIEQLILTANLAELSDFTKKISEAIKTIESLSIEAGGKIYMVGGDNLLAEVNDVDFFLSKFLSLREKLACSFCLGIALDPVRAYIALKFAKSYAPGTIVEAENVGTDIRFRKLSASGYWEML